MASDDILERIEHDRGSRPRTMGVLVSVGLLMDARDEIARLRAVPETLKRYSVMDDGYGQITGMDETDIGRFVDYDELVAAIGGVQ